MAAVLYGRQAGLDRHKDIGVCLATRDDRSLRPSWRQATKIVVGEGAMFGNSEVHTGLEQLEVTWPWQT